MGVYCCFTRTTLFTTMFTLIILVSSLKCMCIPSFILIGFCVSELHAHLCLYHNVWPEVVYCKNYIVYKHVTFLFHGCYGYLSVCKVSLLNSVCLLRYASQNGRIVKMNFYNFNNFPDIRFWSFFEDPHILTIGTFMKTDECLLQQKRGFSECMGSMLANPHDANIQRGYCPFVVSSGIFLCQLVLIVNPIIM